MSDLLILPWPPGGGLALTLMGHLGVWVGFSNCNILHFPTFIHFWVVILVNFGFPGRRCKL